TLPGIEITRQRPEAFRSLSWDETAALPGLRPASRSRSPLAATTASIWAQTTALSQNNHWAVLLKRAAASQPCARLTSKIKPNIEETTLYRLTTITDCPRIMPTDNTVKLKVQATVNKQRKMGWKKSRTPLDTLYNVDSLLYLGGLFSLQSTGEENLEMRLSIWKSRHHRQRHHTRIPYSPQPGETSTSYMWVQPREFQ
ncbi:Hypothetical predicted protein, partial [Pelobates cultripes]